MNPAYCSLRTTASLQRELNNQKRCLWLFSPG